MLPSTCAQCTIRACQKAGHENMPKNCPMQNEELMQKAYDTYALPEIHQFAVEAAEMTAAGYGQWPRIKEIIQFCKRMGYTRVGLAFCSGLKKEAKIADDLFRKAGLEVVSVMCKAGGMSKDDFGIPKEARVHPGEYEAVCNPIGQAMIMNEQKTQFNITFGLCVGHDSLFNKYSEAMVTALVVKDRALGHNPIAAIYCADGYFKNRIL